MCLYKRIYISVVHSRFLSSRSRFRHNVYVSAICWGVKYVYNRPATKPATPEAKPETRSEARNPKRCSHEWGPARHAEKGRVFPFKHRDVLGVLEKRWVVVTDEGVENMHRCCALLRGDRRARRGVRQELVDMRVSAASEWPPHDSFTATSMLECGHAETNLLASIIDGDVRQRIEQHPVDLDAVRGPVHDTGFAPRKDDVGGGSPAACEQLVVDRHGHGRSLAAFSPHVGAALW
jgi:hypothetical protein